ncbi:MAG: beta-1,3-glucanase family protein [Chlamydiota bacterium]
MRRTSSYLCAVMLVTTSAALGQSANLLKVTILNDSDAYSDNQVYVQMLGLDPSGTGNNGHVDLATSTWVAISESDNTVVPPGGPWSHPTYTGYALKLSELTPEGLHTYSFNMPHIISGRIYVSFEQPAYFHVNPGPALEEPSAVDPTLPNYPLIFDKIELDWQNGQDPFLNTTTVDFFSISFMLDLNLLDGTSMSRGFTLPRGAIMGNLQALPAPWQYGMVQNGSTAVRFVAPNKLADTSPFAGYFDSYVNTCWNYYTTNLLTLTSLPNSPAWSATGQVVAGVFTFTVGGTGETVTINNLAGQSAHIFGCDGPGYLFTTGSDSIGKQGIITTMGAALNRGVLYDGQSGIPDTAAWWNDPSLFYAQSPTNSYSKVLHEAAYQGFCYGFSFDDVGGFSTGVQGNAAEAVITIQAMSDQPVVHTVDIKPNKTQFSTTDTIVILVDVTQAIPTPFYPGFYLTLPSGQRLYLTEGNRLTPTASAYLQRKRRKKYVPVQITVPGAESNLQLFSASFRNIPAGNYVLQGGAVNAQTPFLNGDINWIANAEDTEVLRVR